jgi:hypothetical protein
MGWIQNGIIPEKPHVEAAIGLGLCFVFTSNPA